MARTKRLSIEQYFFRAFVARNVFNALCQFPYGLTMKQLVPVAYPHVEFEPEWARSSVQVCICLFNRKARKHRWGLRISGQGGPGSKYMVFVVKDHGWRPRFKQA